MKNTKSGLSLDWLPLFQAFADAFEWALDLAGDFARDFPAEVAAVERVRVFMRRHVAGETAHVRIDDVLLAFGLVMGALERDFQPRQVTTLVPRQRMAAKRSATQASVLSRRAVS